ncbi:protein SEMI-ROLLED LEAF 2 isoform X2 [Hevea brasiliensis]|uniref:protein SEMI-ROLLED LEAF 2 isoform X2 n=1 Tax=Hevea brasiliensis TaxID=3981 RepID=UPI0025DC6C81|nr:protein SEMI-ROLLED LEAF 2 isoform X2 [Hevea brasiliensis]
MGVMSRRVLPVCGNLCFFCPSLRARSRQPVKRYKKFLADIFPRNQEAEPNDRKIGKLCDYASKNPLRIPKITDTLEQRFYKELRHGNFGSVKVVVCIYRKLLSSCKEQMPLFASSLLGIVRTLMEQTGQDEMQILACNILVDFINSQTDSTQMFNLEGIIPKLCQLAQGVGDGERTLRLHSAGLQALASMVSFTGEHSHISMEFDNIISVTLENYIDPQMNPDIINKVSLPSLTTKPELDHTMDTSKSPSYWSRVCLCNMARLAKEATTFRRVLEPLFRNFDTNNHWPLEKGVAYPVLIYLQSLLEEAGDNSHLLLSNLVKHLDHKNVFKEPLVQIDIVNVISQLGQNAKQEVTVTVIDAISDLIKHLRKCLQNAAELSSSGDCIDKQNADLQFAIEKCILQLSNKVGDVGPILDKMAVFLENISTTTIVARTTIFAVHRAGQIIASIPNISYHKKDEGKDNAKVMDGGSWEGDNQILDADAKKFRKSDSSSHSNSLKSSTTDGKTQTSLRLSSHQVSLLLSSLWVQATSAENMPANFEAMAHSYNIALLYTRSKTSNHMALARCFQLAFSLRGISLDQERGLQPSRRRSLFTLASYMLIFSAKAGNFPELIPIVKASLTEKTADPYLESVEDIRLQTVYLESDGGKMVYGSEEDNVAASQSLSAIKLDDHHLKETLISQFIKKFAKLTEVELSRIKELLLQEFLPDDVYPLGAPLFMETPRPCSSLAQVEVQAFEEIMPAASLTDDETITAANANENLSGRKTSLSVNSLDILSVNELLESVLETAQEVASSQISSTPIPYDQMKSQCEALVTGKQQKMSMLQSLKHQHDAKVFPTRDEKKGTSSFNQKVELLQSDSKLNSNDQNGVPDQLALCSVEYGHTAFRLPPSSPYDKFMKAAGC